MTNAYVPREGSVAARALEYLQNNDPDPKSAVDICAEIDENPGGFQTNIGMALRAGVIKATHADGRNWYSVGDGVPLMIPPIPEPAPAPPQPVRAPAAAKKPRRVAKAPKAARQSKAKAPRPARIPKPVVRVKRAYVRKPKAPEAAVPSRAIAVLPPVAALVSTAPSPAPAAGSGLQCALFNTGALFIETDDGNSVNLTKEQTRELVAYLERLAASMETTA